VESSYLATHALFVKEMTSRVVGVFGIFILVAGLFRRFILF
jgi:hypothetical protein